MSESNFDLIAGSADSAVILHIPHSSRVIPADTRQDLLFSDQDLERELDEITDTLTDLVAMESLKKLDSNTPLPWLFINRLSRLVIDPERFPDDREVMNKVGMGAVYTKGTSGKQLRRRTLIAVSCWRGISTLTQEHFQGWFQIDYPRLAMP